MLSFLNLLLTHCGGLFFFFSLAKHPELFMHPWYTVFRRLHWPEIIKSNFTAEWFGEWSERVTARAAMGDASTGRTYKMYCCHHCLPFTVSLILRLPPEGRSDCWPVFLLHSSLYTPEGHAPPQTNRGQTRTVAADICRWRSDWGIQMGFFFKSLGCYLVNKPFN